VYASPIILGTLMPSLTPDVTAGGTFGRDGGSVRHRKEAAMRWNHSRTSVYPVARPPRLRPASAHRSRRPNARKPLNLWLVSTGASWW